MDYIVKGDDRSAVLFPFRVTDDEVEVFDILASTLKSHIKWRLVLHYPRRGRAAR